MTKRETSGPEAFALLIVGLFGIVYGWWANAYALEHIWNWYLPPFAPVMTLKPALGISFVAWLLLSGYFLNKKKKTEEEQSAWTTLILTAVMPWLSLGGARLAFWVFFQ